VIYQRLEGAIDPAYAVDPVLLNSMASGPHMAAAIAGVAAAMLVQRHRSGPAARSTAEISAAPASTLAQDVASFTAGGDRSVGDETTGSSETHAFSASSSNGNSSEGPSERDIQLALHAIGCTCLAVLGRALACDGLAWEVHAGQLGIGLESVDLAFSLISGATAGVYGVCFTAVSV